MSEASTNLYDQVLYPSFALPQADPRRLETLGVLHGMKPAAADRCRVLEVGCGTGMNLLALASLLPASEFVGVDLAQQPIRTGQGHAAELGLRNLRLQAADIRDIDGSWGAFDYILAHGVYSWVPEEVREALLRLCGTSLADQGIAYFSYNTLPGGHLRRMIRDMLLMHSRQADTPESRLSRSRDLLHFLVHGIDPDDVHAAPIRAEAERTARHVDALLFHDDLAEVSFPVYFHEFVAQARRFGLDYLVEADFSEGQELDLPAEALEQLDGLDRVLRAQYLDYLKCRRFRQTLLCRQEVPRSVPHPGLLGKLWIASDARAASGEIDLAPGVEMEFVACTGSNIQSRDPAVKGAMAVLEEAWPHWLLFADLVERTYEKLKQAGTAAVVEEELARVLLQGYATGLIELGVRPMIAEGDEGRPRATELARWQLGRGEAVTTLLLRSILVDDEETRKVLELADGTRGIAELERMLAGVAVSTQIARLFQVVPAIPVASGPIPIEWIKRRI